MRSLCVVGLLLLGGCAIPRAGVHSTSMVAGSTTHGVRNARLERRFGPLLDSLVIIIKATPDSIQLIGNTVYRGTTTARVVQVSRSDDQVALLHELGHFASLVHQRASVALGDSLRFDPYSRSGAERLADTYATWLTVRGDTLHTENPNVHLLARLLASNP